MGIISQSQMRKAFKNTAYGLVTIAVLCVIAFPIWWVITTGFRPEIDMLRRPPQWVLNLTLRSYSFIFQTFPVLRWLYNSTVIAVGATILSLLLGVPAAFGLAKLNFRGKSLVLGAMLTIRAVPGAILLMPFRVFMFEIGLFGTLTSMIFVNTVFNVAFTVWFLTVFFMDFPVELEDAACIDGCSQLKVFRYIVLPLAKPALVTTALFTIIFTWNDFILALGLSTPVTATMPVATLRTVGVLAIGWSRMAAMSTITIVPIILVSIWLQRYYISGLTLGAVKE